MDDSFRRPGAVPFDWEIEPGIPKPQRASSSPTAAAAAPSKLTPPPRMAPALLSPRLLPKSRSQSSSSSPFYPPPPPPTATVPTAVICRSASASPWKQRGQAAADLRKTAGKAPQLPAPAPAFGCFPVPSRLKRKENRKSVLRTEEAALPRRSASSRTSSVEDSLSSSPFFRSSALERDEAEIAAAFRFRFL